MSLFKISMLTFHDKNIFTLELLFTVEILTEFTRHDAQLYLCCHKPIIKSHYRTVTLQKSKQNFL